MRVSSCQTTLQNERRQGENEKEIQQSEREEAQELNGLSEVVERLERIMGG
jgi:hypothetical protein